MKQFGLLYRIFAAILGAGIVDDYVEYKKKCGRKAAERSTEHTHA